MKTLIIILLFLFQQPAGYVTDNVGLLDQNTVTELEQKISEFEKTTQIEIAVLVSELPEGREAFEYALQTAESWGVGKDGADNGIFIYLAPEARKWQILTGYGVESYLTDYQTGRIGREHIVSNMRESNPDQAVISTVGAIMEELGTISLAERKRQAELAEQARKEKLAGLLNILLWVLGMVSFLGLGLFIFFKNKRKKEEEEKRQLKFEKDTDKVVKSANILIDLEDTFDLTGLDNDVDLLKQCISRRQKAETIESAPNVPAGVFRIMEHHNLVKQILLRHSEINYRLPKDPLRGIVLNLTHDTSGLLQKEADKLHEIHKRVKSDFSKIDKNTDIASLIKQCQKADDSLTHYKRMLSQFDELNTFYADLPEEAEQERDEAREILKKVDEKVDAAINLIKVSENFSDAGNYEKAFKTANRAVKIAEAELKEQQREEERERRRERRRRRRARSSSSSVGSSGYGGYSSSSSGSSSFGGFGGGSFGGGGSGGSW